MGNALLKLMIKILNHLPDDDLELITLKGHLILEQELKAILLDSVKQQSPINKARLQFSQLAKIIKAFLYTEENSWLWGAIDKLNKIRNQYAHNLEPDSVLHTILEFVELVETKKSKENSNLEERYRSSIAYICGIINEMKIKI